MPYQASAQIINDGAQVNALHAFLCMHPIEKNMVLSVICGHSSVHRETEQSSRPATQAAVHLVAVRPGATALAPSLLAISGYASRPRILSEAPVVTKTYLHILEVQHLPEPIL